MQYKLTSRLVGWFLIYAYSFIFRVLRVLFATALFSTCCAVTVYASEPQDNQGLVFDDSPLADELELPEWFNLSFLDFKDSLDEAIKDGKKGIIIYYGRKDCAYCKSLLQINWGDPAIVKYTQQHFNVIAIDVRGNRAVTDFNGKAWD